MPYIKLADKARLNNGINWNAMKPGNAGELNYVVSQIVADYVIRKGLKYAVLAEVVAALQGSLDEFTRRIVGPYEDAKIEENGDISHYAILAELLKGGD
jgi:hypothetical protein